MATFNAKFRGLSTLRKVAKTLGRVVSASEVEKTLDQGVIILLDRIKKRFLAAKDTNGQAWPVSKAHLKRKATGTQLRGSTLYDTGALFNSIIATRSGRFERTVSTSLPYAIYHQNGTSKMPKREFIGANQDDIDEITRFFIQKVRRALR